MFYEDYVIRCTTAQWIKCPLVPEEYTKDYMNIPKNWEISEVIEKL